MKSIEITAFLEGSFLNEAIYHEFEHRIFESEPWKSLELDPECQVEAFAYSTGILIRVRTFSLQESFLRSVLLDLLHASILKFSSVEKKRFTREISERSTNAAENFHERAGERFLMQFEAVPKISSTWALRSQFSRITTISNTENWIGFDEVRLAPAWKVPRLKHGITKLSGRSFHLFRLHWVHNVDELVVAIISSTVLRNRLREKFRESGLVYDIHMSAHYECNFLYMDYYWMGDIGSVEVEEFSSPASGNEYHKAFKEANFLMMTWQEDHSFALNVIMGISTDEEQRAYGNMSFEKYLDITTGQPPQYWGCSE